jgi:hypothetical protein
MGAPEFRVAPVPRLRLACLLLLAALPAHGRPPGEQTDNLLEDRFALTLYGIDASATTQVRLDSSTGQPGTLLSGENDLGLKPKKVLWLGEVMMRMKERWRMRLDYYFVPLDRSGVAVLNQPVNFKDAMFPQGDQINSQLSVHLIGVNWAYSFLKGDRYELAASFGFDALELEAAGTVAALVSTQRQQQSQPAPLVGLDGTVKISSRWYLDARMQYLKANVVQISGKLTSWEADVLYRLSPNISFGLGERSFSLDVTSTTVGNSGLLDLKFSGPQVFARFGF